jgi:hypothetical protein
MRTIFAVLITLTICLSGTRRLSAGDSGGVDSSRYPIHALTCPDALLRGCCGVYCPKPTPCITGFCRGCGPSLYCPKPCPFIPCFWGGCGVAYCPKPCPDLCRPLAADFFVCVPSSGGGTGPAACSSATPSSPESSVADCASGDTEIPSVPPQPPLPH